MTTSEPLNVLHLTDCHLLTDEQGVFAGIAPDAYLVQILEQAQQQQKQLPKGEFDYLLCTGDVVHDSGQEQQAIVNTYIRFAQLIRKYFPTIPVGVVPGNHDHYAAMQVLTNYNLSLVGEDQVSLINLNAQWHLLLCDSKLEDRVGGSLVAEQRQKIKHYCQVFPQVSFVLAMHHNPCFTHCQWLDFYPFVGIKEFWQEVGKDTPNLKVITHGHIHQQSSTLKYHTQIYAAPATSIQFKPHSVDFAIDLIAPGYGILTLDADGVCTYQVQRLGIPISYETIAGY